MEFLPIRRGGINHRERRGALLRRFAAVGIFAFGEQRDGLLPILHLGDRDALENIPADEIFLIGDADIRAIHRTRLRQESVQQVGLFGCLHFDLEAEVLAGLLGDGGNRGDGWAGVTDDDILDCLCPNGRESGHRARSDSDTGRRGRASEQLASGNGEGGFRRMV